jgi:ABC-type sugar transport system ATPase subunit
MADVIIRSISKSFGGQPVLTGLSLDIMDGEFVTLLGPSGCGKTTLLRMIAGLETIDSGDLYIAGKRCNDVPPQQRHLAMVFQSYALFPHMNVYANIKFGLTVNKVDNAAAQEKIRWAITLFQLNGLEHRLPRELSGGQRQRVALARALVLDPEVLLLDEPLSNLDTALRETAMEELKRIHSQVGKTIIYVSHNQAEAMSMSGRIALLHSGMLMQYDTPRKVYDEPSTIVAATFIGSPAMNLLQGQIVMEDEFIGVRTSVGFLAFDKELAIKMETQCGRLVMVGIRAQDIVCADHYAGRRYSDSIVSASVELIELLGDRSLIVARGDHNTVLRFLSTREDDLHAGQNLSLFVDGRRLHLFDAETGINILREFKNTL